MHKYVFEDGHGVHTLRLGSDSLQLGTKLSNAGIEEVRFYRGDVGLCCQVTGKEGSIVFPSASMRNGKCRVNPEFDQAVDQLLLRIPADLAMRFAYGHPGLLWLYKVCSLVFFAMTVALSKTLLAHWPTSWGQSLLFIAIVLVSTFVSLGSLAAGLEGSFDPNSPPRATAKEVSQA